ncbi:MAG: HAMP domain-containing histidine kinase [Eubacterium sp.]|nr:HAMP domain-containing histidine kinase [Eubacterium sp.]
MKLKYRLIISFLIMIFVPLILTVTMLVAMNSYVISSLQESYGVEYDSAQDFWESSLAELSDSDATPSEQMYREYIVDMFVCVLLILLFTALMLTFWTYMGIVTPIKRLQLAANNIKEGRLNFTIGSENNNDEIGLLCQDFEAMRVRLKANADDKLKQDKANRELIRNISHDLKTPITSIKGYVEGIMDGVADTPEKQEKYLRIIYNKANEMDALINELTLYSQLDTNEIPYNYKVINVKDFFDDCAEEIGMDLSEKNISFAYENFCKNDDSIMADSEQIMRVVENIVSNSVKYMGKEEEGNIRLTLKDVDSYIQIEIEDNGVGIAKEDIPYIFDRFFRTDSSRGTRAGGSGIGLSIVKKVIEDHGGKVWATSEIGMGTCMFIILKKYEEEEENE